MGAKKEMSDNSKAVFEVGESWGLCGERWRSPRTAGVLPPVSGPFQENKGRRERKRRAEEPGRGTQRVSALKKKRKKKSLWEG